LRQRKVKKEGVAVIKFGVNDIGGAICVRAVEQYVKQDLETKEI